MAEDKRHQVRAWQEAIAPGSGFRVRMDRGAWAAAGQREPWIWSWPRAIAQIAATAGLLVLLVVLLDVEVTALIGGTIGYTILVVRAHALHRRYRREHPERL